MLPQTGKVKGIRGADGKLHPDDKFIQISHAYKVRPYQPEHLDKIPDSNVPIAGSIGSGTA